MTKYSQTIDTLMIAVFLLFVLCSILVLEIVFGWGWDVWRWFAVFAGGMLVGARWNEMTQ